MPLRPPAATGGSRNHWLREGIDHLDKSISSVASATSRRSTSLGAYRMAIIRPVTESDASEWLRMRHALWPDGSVAEHQQDIHRYFAGDRREPAEVLLAIAANGMPVGFAELSIRNIVDGCSTDNVAYLEGWYVVAEARRLGVGRMLFEAAEQWATRRGCTEFASDAFIDDEVSRVAHLGLGFEESGRVRTFRKTTIGVNTNRS